MNKPETETTEKPEAVETPAAPAAEKPDTTQSEKPEAKAPEPTDAPAKPEAGKPQPKEVKQMRFFERQATKAQKEAEALRREVEKLRQGQGQPQTDTQEPSTTRVPNFLDDPDGWAAHKEKEIQEKVFKSIEDREWEANLKKGVAESETWLSNRKHISEDASFAQDVKHLVDTEPDIAALAGVNPKAAAREAYLRVCEIRGVAPDLDWTRDSAKKADAAKKAPGAAPTAPGDAGGKKTWGKGEVTKYLDSVPMGSPEWKSRLAEIKQARAEGRAP